MPGQRLTQLVPATQAAATTALMRDQDPLGSLQLRLGFGGEQRVHTDSLPTQPLAVPLCPAQDRLTEDSTYPR